MNSVNNRKPITLDMKVGQVLKEHPELLEVLVAQSPQFKRLKNPVLRRVHGRLVTLAQAAAVAGIDPLTLVRNLNTAIGQETPDQEPARLPSMAGSPPPAWLETAPVAVELDVREYQRNHEDPFSAILAAVGKVKEGQAFRLRNTFEPLPLYDVLSKRGFIAWARRLGPDDWEIWFLKLDKGSTAVESETAATVDTLDEEEPTATISIDVKDLTPPQPMMRILDALSELRPGETLLVHHVRRPAYLYPKLVEWGCTQRTVERGPGQVDIYIRKGNSALEVTTG